MTRDGDGWEPVLPIKDDAFFNEVDQLRQNQGLASEEALRKTAKRVATEIVEQKIIPKDIPLAPTIANKLTNNKLGGLTPTQLF